MCQVRPGEAVYVHAVGTFGVASASYHLLVAGRRGHRACHAVLCRKQSGHVACTCCGRFLPQGRRSRVSPRTSRLLRCFCRRQGSLFLGQRPQVSDVITWIGFHSSYQLGISQRRAAWFIKWTRTTAEQETFHMAKFEEGLGRVMFVTGALEHERPFMALLYKFMTIHPRHPVQAVPSYVAFFLRLLAGQVEQRRHHPFVVGTFPSSAAPESRCTGVGRANRNRRLASVSPRWTARWTCGRLGGSVWS